MASVSTATGALDFRSGIEKVSYAASGQSAPTLPLNRPALSEQAVPSKLAGLFQEQDVDLFLTDSLRPRELTGALIGSASYGQHLSNLRQRLRDLRAGYPRRDEAFQSGLKLVEEDCENLQLLDALRRVMIGG
jgi:hypothetical protein